MKIHLLDWLACHLTIWGLRRLYGADCETRHHHFNCISCKAAEMIDNIEYILKE